MARIGYELSTREVEMSTHHVRAGTTATALRVMAKKVAQLEALGYRVQHFHGAARDGGEIVAYFGLDQEDGSDVADLREGLSA